MVRRGGLVRSSADERGDATQGGGFAAAPDASMLARSGHPMALQLCLMRMLDEIDYGLLDKPAVSRRPLTEATARKLDLRQDADLDYLDIPAFLRRQAD